MMIRTIPLYFIGVVSANKLNEIGIINPTQLTNKILFKKIHIFYLPKNSITYKVRHKGSC